MKSVQLKNKWQGSYPSYYNECVDSHHFIDLEFICANGLKCFAHQLVVARFSPLMDRAIRAMRQPGQIVSIFVPQFQRKIVRLLIAWLYSGMVKLVNEKQRDTFTDLLDALKIETPPGGVDLEPLGGTATKKRKRDENAWPLAKQIKQEVDLTGEESVKNMEENAMETEGLVNKENAMVNEGDAVKNEGILTWDDFLSIADANPKEKPSPATIPPKDATAAGSITMGDKERPKAVTRTDSSLAVITLEPCNSTEQSSMESSDEMNVQDHGSPKTDPTAAHGDTKKKKATKKPRKTPKKGPKEPPPCAHCNKKCPQFIALMMHMIDNHYQDQLKDLFNTCNGVCWFCPKEKQRQSKNLRTFSIHLGIGHRIVLNFLPEDYKKKVKEYVAQQNDPAIAHFKRIQKKERTIVGEDTLRCFHCEKEFEKNAARQFLSHLSEVVFRTNFEVAFKSNSGVCPYCPSEKAPLKCLKSFADHIGTTHRKIHNYAPEPFKTELKKSVYKLTRQRKSMSLEDERNEEGDESTKDSFDTNSMHESEVTNGDRPMDLDEDSRSSLQSTDNTKSSDKSAKLTKLLGSLLSEHDGTNGGQNSLASKNEDQHVDQSSQHTKSPSKSDTLSSSFPKQKSDNINSPNPKLQSDCLRSPMSKNKNNSEYLSTPVRKKILRSPTSKSRGMSPISPFSKNKTKSNSVRSPRAKDKKISDLEAKLVKNGMLPKCFHCGIQYPISLGKNRLLRHLICVYRQNFRKLFDSTKGKCHLCVSNPYKTDAFGHFNEHVGLYHRKCHEFVPEEHREEVLDLLNLLEPRARSDSEDNTSEQGEAIPELPKSPIKSSPPESRPRPEGPPSPYPFGTLSGDDLPDIDDDEDGESEELEAPPVPKDSRQCFHCEEFFPNKDHKGHLLRHFCSIYQEKFRSMFKTNSKRCPYCPKQNKPFTWLCSFVDHVGVTHKELHKYVPRCFKNQILELYPVEEPESPAADAEEDKRGDGKEKEAEGEKEDKLDEEMKKIHGEGKEDEGEEKEEKKEKEDQLEEEMRKIHGEEKDTETVSKEISEEEFRMILDSDDDDEVSFRGTSGQELDSTVRDEVAPVHSDDVLNEDVTKESDHVEQTKAEDNEDNGQAKMDCSNMEQSNPDENANKKSEEYSTKNEGEQKTRNQDVLSKKVDDLSTALSQISPPENREDSDTDTAETETGDENASKHAPANRFGSLSEYFSIDQEHNYCRLQPNGKPVVTWRFESKVKNPSLKLPADKEPLDLSVDDKGSSKVSVKLESGSKHEGKETKSMIPSLKLPLPPLKQSVDDKASSEVTVRLLSGSELKGMESKISKLPSPKKSSVSLVYVGTLADNIWVKGREHQSKSNEEKTIEEEAKQKEEDTKETSVKSTEELIGNYYTSLS